MYIVCLGDVCTYMLYMYVCLWYLSICSEIGSWDLVTDVFSLSSPKAEPQMRLACEWFVPEWTWKKGESMQICAITLAITRGDCSILTTFCEAFLNAQNPPPEERGDAACLSLWPPLSAATRPSADSPVLRSWAPSGCDGSWGSLLFEWGKSERGRVLATRSRQGWTSFLVLIW